MIDSHCHLTFPQFRDRVDEVMSAARAAGVRAAVTISTTTRDAEEAARVAEADPRVVFTTGIHPLHSDEPIDWVLHARMARHPKCVAFGELGLDGHHPTPARELQERVLQEQLARVESLWSAGVTLPLVIHSRKSVGRLLPILRASTIPCERMVFHCFTESVEDARLILDAGAWISFTGAATFKSAESIRDTARLVPLDRIMVETDAPYLTPEPHRAVRPNEPKFVTHVAACIARARGMDAASFEAATDSNAVRFFGPALGAACAAP